MATFFTKSEAQIAARHSAVSRASANKSSQQVLKEERIATGIGDAFDVFLSHAIADADIVLGVKRILEQLGQRVYVDWDTDRQLDRSQVTPETADLLRTRMKQCKSLLYLATDASSSSKWMPWELGYFDGFRNGMVAVLPVLERANESFVGQEYLGLYPKVNRDKYKNTGTPDVFVMGPSRWTTLKDFGAGNPTWRSFG